MDELAKPRSLKQIESHLRSKSSQFYDSIPDKLKDDISSFISSNKERSLEFSNPLKNVEDSTELGPEEKKALKLLIAAHSVQIYMKNDSLLDQSISECKKYLEMLSLEGGVNVTKINQEIINKTKEMHEENEVAPEKLTKTLSGILTLPSLEDDQRDEVVSLINLLVGVSTPQKDPIDQVIIENQQELVKPAEEQKIETINLNSLTIELAQKYVNYIRSQDPKDFHGLDADFLEKLPELILETEDLRDLLDLIIIVNNLLGYDGIDYISKCLQLKVRAALWRPLEKTDALETLVLRLNILKSVKFYYHSLEDVFELICDLGLENIENFDDVAAIQFLSGIREQPFRNEAKSKLLNKDNDHQNSKIWNQLNVPSLISSLEQVIFERQLYNDFSRSNYTLNINKVNLLLDCNRIPAADKCYTTRTLQELTQFFEEIKILFHLHQTETITFLKFYGWLYYENPEKTDRQHELHIIMEYCPRTFNEEIQKRKSIQKKYEDTKIFEFLDVLARGYNQLKELKIVHRDIKPDNIFIDEKNHLKIADFNTSINVPHSINTVKFEKNYAISGTTSYFAPEMFQAYELYKRHQGERSFVHNPLKCDVFSLGITMLEAATLENIKGLNSFSEHPNLQEHIDLFINKNIQNEHLKNLLKSMLKVDPQLRPSFRELVGIIKTASVTKSPFR